MFLLAKTNSNRLFFKLELLFPCCLYLAGLTSMDRGLLVALLALQKEFLTRQQFLAAFKAWLVNQFLKLDEILVQRAFLTKSQLERLSSSLKMIQEKNSGEWKMVVKENEAVKTIYNDMLALAERNPTIFQMVKLIGEAMDNNPLPEGAGPKMVMRIDLHSTTEPIEGTFDPYATLSAKQHDESE